MHGNGRSALYMGGNEEWAHPKHSSMGRKVGAEEENNIDDSRRKLASTGNGSFLFGSRKRNDVQAYDTSTKTESMVEEKL